MDDQRRQPDDARQQALDSLLLQSTVDTGLPGEQRLSLPQDFDEATCSTPYPATLDENDSFREGALLGGRFRIVRQVGSGGMGLVYEAIDEMLDRRVALKCARPGHGDRLPPEVRAAREVSHFNVCKVHDLHVASTPLGETEFISMECIDGETLSRRIHRDGPLPDADARDIANQICAGLAQAHRQGVIHGDLKCANVILTQSPEGNTRAVITDFGLAKMTLVPSARTKGGTGGTLDYMAPELLLGQGPTVASDIYALGILFHVMLTGHVPERTSAMPKRPVPIPRKSDSRASTQTLGRVVIETQWQRAIENLPAPWAKIISGCLTPTPEKRFSSAEAVSQAFEPRRKAVLWFVSAAVAIVALGIGYSQWQGGQMPSPALRLAILPFSVEGDPVQNVAGIGLDIADRLSGARRNFTVISPVEAQRVSVNVPTKAKNILGATHVLQARLRGEGASIIAEASVVDLSSGNTLGTLHGTYPSNDGPALAKAILATTTGALRLGKGSPKESVSPAAYPYYVQAIGLLRQDIYTAGAAIPLFRKAIELDPRSALPYAGLAQAQLSTFQKDGDSKLLEAAGDNIAKAKSINSDSVPVLLISGSFQQEHGGYESAIHDFTRATELEPNNAEGWKRLAKAYANSSRSDEAIATYRRAIQTDPNYFRNYLEFGNFYLYRNQFHEAEELYRRVTTIAPDLVSGHTNLGLALMRQLKFAPAEESLLHALRLRKSPALLMNIGALYYAQEQYTKALPFFEESIASGPPSAIRFRDLGDVYRHLGRATEAATAYRSARDMAQDALTRNPRQANSRVLLALVLAFLKDARRAESEASQALAIEPENAMVMREAVITYEALHNRDTSLRLLANAPRPLLEELSHDPDVKDLQQDTRFVALLQKEHTQ